MSAKVIGVLQCELPTYEGDPDRQHGTGGTVELDDIVSAGPTARESLPLELGQTIRVGRAKRNDLMIERSGVSRFHAVFSASSSGIVLSDLASLNGTFVNGRRIATPVDLKDGDVVLIGGVRIVLSISRGATDSGDDSLQSTRAGELRAVVVTVLVADVPGYARSSRELSEQDAATALSRWFELVARIVDRNGGEVDKYIGDCVMGLFRGEPGANDDSTVRAVTAARLILEETAHFASSESWPHESTHPWSCRVALNTGDALFGTMGGGQSRELSVLGDTVNIAFRLEGIATKMGVPLIMGPETVTHLGSAFPVHPLGPAILEGRRDTVEVFTLGEFAPVK